MDQDKFPGNSKLSSGKKPTSKDLERKKLEKIVTEPAEYKKQSIGDKLKGLFLAADFKSTTGYIFREVMLPATRNMMHDAVTKSAERVFYGERVSRPPGRSKSGYVHYGSASRQSIVDLEERRPRPEFKRKNRSHRETEILMGSHHDASMVLERMWDIVDNHEFVSVADMNELCGLPIATVNHNRGWYNLTGSEILNSRDGYILSLPMVEDR